MKTTPTVLLLGGMLALSSLTTGCVIIRNREVPPPQTVVTTTYQPGYVVTTLPSGYETRTYSREKYYYYNGVYYRAQGNRYVVVTQPR